MRDVPGRAESERRREEAARARDRSLERSRARRKAAARSRDRVIEQSRARREATSEHRRANMARARREREVSLLDLVDRLLDGGVVIHGDITLAVADVDLVYVGLRALVASVESVEPKLGSALPQRKE